MKWMDLKTFNLIDAESITPGVVRMWPDGSSQVSITDDAPLDELQEIINKTFNTKEIGPKVFQLCMIAVNVNQNGEIGEKRPTWRTVGQTKIKTYENKGSVWFDKETQLYQVIATTDCIDKICELVSKSVKILNMVK